MCICFLFSLARTCTLFVHSLLCSLSLYHTLACIYTFRLSVFRQISFFVFFFSYKISQKSHQPLFATKQPKYRVMLPRRETTTTHRKRNKPFFYLSVVRRATMHPPPPYSPSTLLASSHFQNDPPIKHRRKSPRIRGNDRKRR